MKLFVGLGNPGAQYENTRHNIGFLAIDAIAEAHGFSPFRSKFQGRLSEGKLGIEKVLLLKPETFMNLSGQSVGEAMRYYKLEPEEVAVFHDELDLAPGRIKVKRGGGHAGHNGLRSLHEHIGADFQRVRIGIGHPGDKRMVSHYVLHAFAKADRDWVDPLLAGVADGAPLLASGDGPGFLNKVALKMQPAKSPAPKPSGRAPERPDSEPSGGADETPAAESDPPLSPLERLVRRFSKSER